MNTQMQIIIVNLYYTDLSI